jgi:hypothetical protein
MFISHQTENLAPFEDDPLIVSSKVPQRPVTGEYALWVAVLQDAAMAYLQHPAGHRYHREAVEWFTYEGYEVTSYRWVCDMIGIDAEWFWGNRHRWRNLPFLGNMDPSPVCDEDEDEDE